jgi:hypothetical protein
MPSHLIIVALVSSNVRERDLIPNEREWDEKGHFQERPRDSYSELRAADIVQYDFNVQVL